MDRLRPNLGRLRLTLYKNRLLAFKLINSQLEIKQFIRLIETAGSTNTNPVVVDGGNKRSAPKSGKKAKRMKKRIQLTNMNTAIHKVVADNLQGGLTSREIQAALEEGIMTLRNYSTGDTSSDESQG